MNRNDLALDAGMLMRGGGNLLNMLAQRFGALLGHTQMAATARGCGDHRFGLATGDSSRNAVFAPFLIVTELTVPLA